MRNLAKIEKLIKEVRDNLDYIRVCDFCNGEVVEKMCGTEGLSVCKDCRIIEGGSREIPLWEYEENNNG